MTPTERIFPGLPDLPFDLSPATGQPDSETEMKVDMVPNSVYRRGALGHDFAAPLFFKESTMVDTRNEARSQKRRAKKTRSKVARRKSVADEFASESKYMKALDVTDAGGEMVLTIASNRRETMPGYGGEKRVVYWHERDVKPTVLNKTNGKLLVASISEFEADWAGHTVRLTTAQTSMGPGIVFEVLDDEDDYATEEDDYATEEEEDV